MRSNAVGGGGNSYFMLGVGGCNYDASTVSYLFERLSTCLHRCLSIYVSRNICGLQILVACLYFQYLHIIRLPVSGASAGLSVNSYLCG
jgi:hypothetical protein